ncbi:MAG: sulfite exporter TauE/SafE family protein [Phycisphaerae bacterium]
MTAWFLLPTDVDNVATFLVLGSLSAMLFSMAKAGFGGSAGMLAVPLMIFACGGRVRLAAGILLPILIAADYVAVIGWLGKWNRRTVGMLLPGTVLGVAAGWAVIHLLGRLDAVGGKQLADAWLKLGVGAIALAFVALQAVRAVRGRALSFRPVFWQASLAGSTAGLTSTVAHAAGPIVTMYLLPQQMPKGRYVASTALYFWVANQVKLVPYFAEDMINTATLGAGVVLLPAIAAGAVLGILLHRKVPQRQFTGIVYVLLALAGIGLCYKGAEALAG